MAVWNKSAGKVSKGLKRRRAAEAELWGKPAPHGEVAEPAAPAVVVEANTAVVSTPQPVVGGAKDDEPKQVTSDWWDSAKVIPSKVYGAFAVGGTLTFSLVSEAIGFIRDNRTVVVWAGCVVTIVGVCLYLAHRRNSRDRETQQQRFEMEKRKLEIAADPTKINVQ